MAGPSKVVVGIFPLSNLIPVGNRVAQGEIKGEGKKELAVVSKAPATGRGRLGARAPVSGVWWAGGGRQREGVGWGSQPITGLLVLIL